nr:hypothetical protein [Tanacetum cinerariifolium]
DSSLPFARPYRKRCRSPTTLVPSVAPALADLSSRKRFRDSYSSEDSGEEHMKIGIIVAETVVDLGISDGDGAPTKDGIGMGVEVSTSDIREDEEEFEAEASAGGIVMILGGDLGGWSHLLRGVWDFAVSLVVPRLCRRLD